MKRGRTKTDWKAKYDELKKLMERREKILEESIEQHKIFWQEALCIKEIYESKLTKCQMDEIALELSMAQDKIKKMESEKHDK